MTQIFGETQIYPISFLTQIIKIDIIRYILTKISFRIVENQCKNLENQLKNIESGFKNVFKPILDIFALILE